MSCLVCGAQKFSFAFKAAGNHLLECSGCGILARRAPGGAERRQASLGREALKSLLDAEMSLRGVRGQTAVFDRGEVSGGPFAGIALVEDLLADEDPLALLAALRARLQS